MVMLRRAFLKAVSAAAVAGLVGVGSFRPIYPKAEKRAWLWQEFTGFHQGLDFDVWVGHLTAQRSDGTHFCVPITEPGDIKYLQHKDAWPLRIREDMEVAARALDDFRDCACQVGYQCPRHSE